MHVLHSPLDFERWPEFRQIVQALTARQNAMFSPALIEAVAMQLWQRLWVELGYIAQKTNEPGRLTSWGAVQFKNSVQGLFGDDCDPLKLLTEGPEEVRLLKPLETEWMCPLFARFNAHLAGDYKTPAQRGNANSAISRKQKHLEREAVHQGMLIPAEVFVDLEGRKIEGSDANRCIVLIRNLDNVLGRKMRDKGEYTQGLMAQACAVVRAHELEELREFYTWLAANKEKPTMPRTAEQLLPQFETHFAVAGV